MYVVNVNKARFVYFTLDKQSVSMPRKAVKKGTKGAVCGVHRLDLKLATSYW